MKEVEDKTLFEDLEKLFSKPCSKLCPNCPEEGWQIYKHSSHFNGCCTNCRGQGGFFESTFESIHDYSLAIQIKKDKFGWDNIYGFFNNEKKECRLPRSERSVICLSYICKTLKKEIDNSNLDVMEKRLDELKTFRRKNKLLI